jgi:hypothetical protein
VGESTKKAVKPCITALQIAQFVVILVHSCFHLSMPNRYWSWTLAAVQTALMFQMLFMFGDFFARAYLGGGGKGAAGGAAPARSPVAAKPSTPAAAAGKSD